MSREKSRRSTSSTFSTTIALPAVCPTKPSTSAEIIDNGCGIPKERLKTLFTGTTLTQDTSSGGKHGMGIGLSVCAAIIKAHGGEIKAESTPGEGTTIRFWLETEEVDTEETEDEQ